MKVKLYETEFYCHNYVPYNTDTLTFKFYIMKSFILILGALLFCAQTFSQNANEEAIKKVCIAETKAFNDFDFDAMASYHVQSANDQLAVNKPNGSFSSKSGWEAIGKALNNYFQSNKKEAVKLASENFSFVILDDMAFACYNASSQNTKGKTSQSKEFRTLQKINGEWKILAVLAYVDHPSGK
jgi:ketosteroid isomerase-like protein